jgi:hypothetical protein
VAKLVEWLNSQDPAKVEFMRRYDVGWSLIDNILHLSFITIKETIPKLIEQNKFEEAIATALSMDVKKIYTFDEIKRFRLYLWLLKQYEKIGKMEMDYLSSPPDAKLAAAGISDLDPLGITNTIDLLAGGDITKWAEVRELPYADCFEKQLKMLIESRIEKKLVVLMKDKAK